DRPRAPGEIDNHSRLTGIPAERRGHPYGGSVSHHHHSNANRTRLSIVLGIVGVVLVIEVVGAILTGSLALLADAGHMFSDTIGLTVALAATIIAAKPATERATFGFQR